MEQGRFCFLSDQYYLDFPDKFLMQNKETIGTSVKDRPCFFAFPDKEHTDVLWLVPVSSQIEKYQALYHQKIERYGFCNTIRFGEVLGTKAAFLIQNMCPATMQYINNIYVDLHNKPICIDNRVVQDVIKNAKEVLNKQEKGAFLIFPDIFTIKEKLLEQLRAKQPDKTSLSARLNAAKQKCEQINAERSLSKELETPKQER